MCVQANYGDLYQYSLGGASIAQAVTYFNKFREDHVILKIFVSLFFSVWRGPEISVLQVGLTWYIVCSHSSGGVHMPHLVLFQSSGHAAFNSTVTCNLCITCQLAFKHRHLGDCSLVCSSSCELRVKLHINGLIQGLSL